MGIGFKLEIYIFQDGAVNNEYKNEMEKGYYFY